MQINNNFQSQSFGMALKIKSDALPVLRNQSQSVLNKIAKAGEELADTKYWDVVVGAKKPEGGGAPYLTYTVKGNHCANAYIDTIRPAQEPRDEFLIIKSVWGGTEGIGGHHIGEECSTIMRLPNKDAALNAYKSLKENPYGIDNATAATRVLENWSNFQAECSAVRSADYQQRQNLANNLFEKFGVND